MTSVQFKIALSKVKKLTCKSQKLINIFFIRFWAVQILFVGTPSIVFIVFAMHKMSTLSAKKAKEEMDENGKGCDLISKSNL